MIRGPGRSFCVPTPGRLWVPSFVQWRNTGQCSGPGLAAGEVEDSRIPVPHISGPHPSRQEDRGKGNMVL